MRAVCVHDPSAMVAVILAAAVLPRSRVIAAHHGTDLGDAFERLRRHARGQRRRRLDVARDMVERRVEL